MLALFAGTGQLPHALVDELRNAEHPLLVCEMAGFPVEGLADVEIIPYRLETLGTLLQDLRVRGVSEVCLAGAVRRPDVDPSLIDEATKPLVPILMTAMAKGDDGALRGIIAMFEEQEFAVRAAHEIAPALLPASGWLVAGEAPSESDLTLASAVHKEMSDVDLGQALVVRDGAIIAREGQGGTDAMLSSLCSEDRGDRRTSKGGVLYKAPKANQDRRADLPVIGPTTIVQAAEAGLRAIVIEAGGVMVLDQPKALDLATKLGIGIWVREAVR